MSVAETIMKIPAVRRLFTSFFSFCINLDHLWLYVYHEREYGTHVKKLLMAVHKYEQIKWDFFSEQIQNSTFYLT